MDLKIERKKDRVNITESEQKQREGKKEMKKRHRTKEDRKMKEK